MVEHYCHECAEATLRYTLKLNGLPNNLESDKAHHCFYLNTDTSSYTISMKFLTLAWEGRHAISKDYSLFVQSLKEFVKP